MAPAGPSWRDLLQHWRLIEADLHETFGIDLGDRDLLAARSWRWLRSRIESLADTPDALTFDGMSGCTFQAPTNRLRWALVGLRVIEPEKGGG